MLLSFCFALASIQTPASEFSIEFVDPNDLLIVGSNTETLERPADSSSSADSFVPAQGTGLRFIENRGQWAQDARFAVDAGRVRGWLEADAITLDLRAGGPDGQGKGSVVRLAFEGAAEVEPRGEDVLPGTYSYFLGRDVERWAQGVRAFDGVTWSGLYPGIDLVLRDGGDWLEYDLVIGEGGDIDEIRVRADGARSLAIDGEGSLVIATEHGELKQAPPTTWAILANGAIMPLDCRFRLLGGLHYGFDIPELPEAAFVVIDPGLEWSTYLGGLKSDLPASGMQVDGAGRIFIGGISDSANFPTTPGAYDQNTQGAADAYVACFSADGTTLIWATFFGGVQNFDRCRDMSIDAAGNVIIAGETNSADMPVTAGAIQSSHAGGLSDGFIAVLNPSGTQLLGSTYLGGSGVDFQEAEYVLGVEVEDSGAIVVSGNTNSPDFPTTVGAFDTNHNPGDTGAGAYDAFVARLNTACTTLDYSTFIGGSGVEYGYDIALRGDNEVAIGIATSSPDAPVTPGCFDTTYVGAGLDTLVVILDLGANGNNDLIYSSYWGGAATEYPFCIDVGPTGEPTVAGATFSEDCDTTTGAFRETSEADTAHFAYRIAPLGQGAADLVYSTYYGGPQPLGSYVMGFTVDMHIDEQDRVTFTGDSSSPSFHVTSNAIQSTWGGSNDQFQWGDAMILRLRFDGNGQGDLIYGTYLGGLTSQRGKSVYSLPGDVVVNAGYTFAGYFPITSGSYDQTFGGGQTDTFLLRADLSEVTSGVAFCFGDGSGSTCPCVAAGALEQGCPNTNPNGNGAKLAGTGTPSFANDTFGFAITDGAFSKPGILIQGGAALNYPNGNPNVPNASGIFCVNPTLRGGVFFTDGGGNATVTNFQGQPFGATAQPTGSTTYYQYWFRDPSNPCQNGPGTAAAFNFSNGWEASWSL